MRGKEVSALPRQTGIKEISKNRKAFHEYFVLERFEAGIELAGTEVKSIRAGQVNLKDSFCTIKDGELFVRGMHISPYEHGNIFRSGCTFTRGYGKIFYFQPGHETNGSFSNPYVRRIIQNAVRWCYNDKNRRITLGAPSIEVTLEQARLEGNTGEYLKMWD